MKTPARRTARPVGRPGHHYTECRAGAASRRRPGDLSADHGHAVGAKSKVVRGFSFFGASSSTSSSRTAPTSTGLAVAVLEYLNFACRMPAQGRRHPQIGPDATGVGWVYRICRARQGQDVGRTAHLAGLVSALSTDQGATAWPKSPRSAASCRPTRSPSIRSSCVPTASRWLPGFAGHPRAPTATSAVAWSRWPETEYMVRGRATCAAPDIENWSSRATGERQCWCATSPGSNWSPTSAAA